MSATKEGNQKKKAVSWQEKKSMADQEEEALRKEVDNLRTWVEMMESMTAEQKMKYLQNRPNELKTMKIQRSKLRPRIQGVEKSKPSTSTGILASVWKFHKEEDEELKRTSDV